MSAPLGPIGLYPSAFQPALVVLVCLAASRSRLFSILCFNKTLWGQPARFRLLILTHHLDAVVAECRRSVQVGHLRMSPSHKEKLHET